MKKLLSKGILLLGIFSLNLPIHLFAQEGIQEQIKLHLNKDLFVAGEMIWGKAYIQDALFEKPSQLSKYVYLELWDAQGSLIKQNKVLAEGGSGGFSMRISSQQSSGNYELRAYTKWMANESSANFARKLIRIYQPTEALPLASSDDDRLRRNSLLQIFPEGGQLIHDLESRIAIRLTDDHGKPKSAVGRVEIGDGSVVAAFQTDEKGLATFNLRPDSAQQYGIRILENADSSKLYSMANIQAVGVNMQLLSRNAMQLALEIKTRGVDGPLFLSVNKGLYEMQKIPLSLSEGLANTLVNLIDYPSGKWLLKVVDEKGKQLAWRYIWRGEKEEMKLDLKLSKQAAATREKMVLDILSTDASGNPTYTDLAISVRRKSPESRQPQRDLTNDMEMMTQAAPLAGRTRGKRLYPEMYGLTISGRVKALRSRDLSSARLIFSLPGKNAYMRTMKTNERGRFNLVLENIYGVREIGMLAVDKEGTPLNIELDEVYFGETPFPAPLNLRFTEEELAYLEKEAFYQQVYKAYQDTLNESIVGISPSFQTFFHPPDREYILDEYTRFDTEETFNEIVYSVGLRKKKGNYFFKVYNKISGTLMNETPLVLFDGIPLNNVNALLEINSKLIEKIEVLTSLYYQDNFPIHGIVNVVSFKGDASSLDLPAAYLRKPFTFLSPERIFHKLDHEADQEKYQRIPDYRTNLLWEPKLISKADGTASLEFYTSDLVGEFEVIVSATNLNGEMGRKSLTFIVEESPKP
ncbi:MAG: hypothetical protein R8P61_34525 [Bacteroidia bacterium]|nr:hypothetical protein [Bacteroidia bacterium]